MPIAASISMMIRFKCCPICLSPKKDVIFLMRAHLLLVRHLQGTPSQLSPCVRLRPICRQPDLGLSHPLPPSFVRPIHESSRAKCADRVPVLQTPQHEGLALAAMRPLHRDPLSPKPAP